MTGIGERLERARVGLERVAPAKANELRERGAKIVDIRPHANRAAEGEIPDSVVLERIVLEWRLDPNGPDRLPGLSEQDTVLIMCNEGYASSLAAEEARGLGLRNATDIVGGFRAWAAAGLPVREGGSAPTP